jgi:hypothetical protein
MLNVECQTAAPSSFNIQHSTFNIHHFKQKAIPGGAPGPARMTLGYDVT